MKTHEARTVDLTPHLTATLKRRLTWLRAEALRNGSGEPEWLFPRADGTLMNKDYAAGVFRRILKRAGLPHHPGVRPPAHLRQPHARRERPNHRRLGAARTLEPRNDDALLRPVDPEPGQAVGQRARPETESKRAARGGVAGTRKWNQRRARVMERAKVLEEVGSPGWARTSDFLINSKSTKHPPDHNS